MKLSNLFSPVLKLPYQIHPFLYLLQRRRLQIRRVVSTSVWRRQTETIVHKRRVVQVWRWRIIVVELWQKGGCGHHWQCWTWHRQGGVKYGTNGCGAKQEIDRSAIESGTRYNMDRDYADGGLPWMQQEWGSCQMRLKQRQYQMWYDWRWYGRGWHWMQKDQRPRPKQGGRNIIVHSADRGGNKPGKNGYIVKTWYNCHQCLWTWKISTGDIRISYDIKL